MNEKKDVLVGMMYYYCIICSSIVGTYVEVFLPWISFLRRSTLCRISITVTLANEQQLNRGDLRE